LENNQGDAATMIYAARPLLFASLVVPTLLTAAVVSRATQSERLALDAVAANEAAAAKAQDALRALGPPGLEDLLKTHGWTLAAMRSLPPDVPFTPEQHRLARAVDRVARQKDGWMAGLYWHTRLEDALAEAEATHKAVLSLQMLGNLDEDFSCANSRFFRTLLYSNPTVAAVMREHFVLVWSAVRPVPKVTVELGDGRVLFNTLTGNSAHLVLNASGNVVDVIPGLHSPTAFAAALEAAAAVERVSRDRNLLPAWHTAQAALALETFAAMRTRLGDNAPAADWLAAQQLGRLKTSAARRATAVDGEEGRAGVVRARFAMRAAMSKARVEMPMAAPFFGGEGVDADEAIWQRLGDLEKGKVVLHGQSWNLILRKHQSPLNQGQPAGLRRTALEQTLTALVAQDTVKNQLLFHRALHQRLARGLPTVQQFVPELYEHYFVMPPQDVWMGLLTPETYVGLDGAGATQPDHK